MKPNNSGTKRHIRIKKLLKYLIRSIEIILAVFGFIALIWGNIPSLREEIEIRKTEKLRKEYKDYLKNNDFDKLYSILNDLEKVPELSNEYKYAKGFCIAHFNDYYSGETSEKYLLTIDPADTLFTHAIMIQYAIYYSSKLSTKDKEKKFEELVKIFESHFLTPPEYFFIKIFAYTDSSITYKYNLLNSFKNYYSNIVPFDSSRYATVICNKNFGGHTNPNYLLDGPFIHKIYATYSVALTDIIASTCMNKSEKIIQKECSLTYIKLMSTETWTYDTFLYGLAAMHILYDPKVFTQYVNSIINLSKKNLE
jgi:hypothetical protein